VERVRTWSTVPIIALSVRAGDEDKVRLLEYGADDYVVKPFSMAELLARARGALRRHARGTKSESIVKHGRLSVDLANRAVFLDGARVVLSSKEYRLLQVLAQHAGNVVTHNMLLKEVWGIRNLQNGHYLRMLVRRLRRKIERNPKQPRILVSELGVGYRLASDLD
jgi:two-component system KDP operon response regulator KdpE